MASEITYAEVKFKNAPPAAAVEVPPETKKHEHRPQKYPLWLPWLISLLLLLVCIALIALLVVPLFHCADQPTALQQNFMEWECITTMPQGKERGLRCCPKGWIRFQEKCYYLSADEMSWDESVQNCTGMGSHLVVINSEAEQGFLTKELQKFPQGINFYIGLTASELGKWQWVDQTPLNEKAAFWRKGEPSDMKVEKCVVIHTSPDIRNWNDSRCESHHRICAVAAPSF